MSVRRMCALIPLVALAAIFTSAPVLAQEVEPTVAWFYTAEVAPADMAAVNEGLAGWVDRLEEDGETWAWNVFSTVTGPPRFVIMTPGHTYADFDRDPIVTDEGRMAENEEYMQQNVTRYMLDARSEMMQLRPDISLTVPQDMTPAFWQVISWEITDGSTEGYLAITNAFTKVREAFTAMSAEAEAAGEGPLYYNVFNVMYGEGPPRMLVALPFDEFAELDGGDPLAFFNALAAVHGHEDAVAVERVFSRYLKQVEANIYAWRADLSYAPDGM